MKIKKYGYSQFNKTSSLRFAVMVPSYEMEGEGEDRHVKSCQWRFVTDIWVGGKRVWEANNQEAAYLWDDRKSAQDFCIGLAWNFTAGFVVEVLEGMEPTNNW